MKRNQYKKKKFKNIKPNIQNIKQKTIKKIKSDKKLMILSSLIMVLVFTVVLSASYAFFTTTVKGKEFVIYTGNLAVNYEKKTDVINVENLYPMTNEVGLNQTSHEFTVTNKGNISARYQIRLELDSTVKDMVPIEYVKLAYNIDGGSYSTPVLLSDLNSSLAFLKDVVLDANNNDTIGIKLWIDISAPNEIQGKTFKARVVVDSIQNVEDGYEINTAPIITLKKDSSGNYDVNLKVNETYTELGVERVEDDNEIFTPSQVTKSYEYYDGTNLTTVSSVDTSKTGIYYITYSITDSGNNIGKAVRIVTVNNTDTIPSITLNGDASITLGEYDSYIESGVTVAENNKVIVLGKVKTSTKGTYVVRYIVVDKNGNLNSVVRTVVVSNTYSEVLLNGADPVLTDNLVPVQIANDGTVTKASTLSTWYNYETKQWANAVVTRNSYDTLNSNGKVNGATKNDGYVSFDGIDDYIDLGYSGYDFGNSMTMAITVSFNELRSDVVQEFLGNPEGAGSGCGFNKISQIYCQSYLDSLGKYSVLKSTEAIELNKYYTIVMVYDGVTHSMYLNGKLQSSVEIAGNIVTSLVPIFLGVNPNANGNHAYYSNVNIKEVAVFDRAVTVDEIQDSFSDGIRIYNGEDLLIYEDFSNKLYANDEVIPEDNIESYFVWIPRYKYKIFNTGSYSGYTTFGDNTQEIAIVFENKDVNISNGTKIDEYVTHPAFTAFDTNGIWVGKFETGYDGATSNATAQVNSNDSNKIIIKPNVYSWRSSTVGNAFSASYEYLKDDDSHMMKNTEWGAIAYLSHSVYGTCTKTDTGTTCDEIRINNNGSYITGYAATVAPTVGTNGGTSIEGNLVESTSLGVDGTNTVNYLNSLSGVASTSGNKTGIYDISGGSWEYVMGYTTGATTEAGNSGIITLYSDFLSNSAWDKYYDEYSATGNTNYNKRILGDATGEMGPFGRETDLDENVRYKSSWYKDYGSFANSASPWFARGGAWYYGTSCGAFAFSRDTGAGGKHLSFRVVLAPQSR